METENNTLIDKEIVTGMFGAMGRNLKRVITILAFLGLITLNVLTLASSTMHNLLYGALSSIPIASMSELLADSPTEKKKKLDKKNKKLNKQLTAQKKKTSAIKLKTRKIAGNVKKRVAKTAAANVTSAFGESVPFYGVAIIASATAYELWSACENMKDMDSILSETDIADDGETNKVCGTKTPGKEDLLASLEFTKDRYGEFQDDFGAFLHDFTTQSENKWDTFQDTLGGTIYEMFH